MSGAEAVVGVVSAGAGLLSLSLQLGESVVKLKSFHKRFKTAPETVQELVFDLETLCVAVQQLNHHEQNDKADSALLIRCIDQCRRHADTVSATVVRMEEYLTRHNRIGKFYVALKDPEIRSLLDKMQQGRSSLHLAVSMYYSEESARRLEMQHRVLLNEMAIHDNALKKRECILQASNAQLSQRIDNVLRALPGTHSEPPLQVDLPFPMVQRNLAQQYWNEERRNDDDDKQPVEISRGSSQRRKQPSTYRFQFPRWFSSRIWSIAIQDAASGWDINIRVSVQRPGAWPLFWHCQNGRLDQVQRLLASGQASLSDVDEDGESSLYVSEASAQLARQRTDSRQYALEGAHAELCRWIVGQSPALVWELDLSKVFSMYYLLRREPEHHDSRTFHRDLLEGYNIFLESGGLDVDVGQSTFESEMPGWWLYCPDEKLISTIARLQIIPFTIRPLEEKVLLLYTVTESGPLGVRPSILLKTFGLTVHDLYVAGQRTYSRALSISYAGYLHRSGSVYLGGTALHWTATHLARRKCRLSPALRQEWSDLAVALICAGADPLALLSHPRKDGDVERFTPLGFVFSHCLTNNFIEGRQFVKTWASIILDSGRNLLLYGAAESRLWVSGLRVKLVYGDIPEPWSLYDDRTQRKGNLHVRKLSQAPGAFPEISWIPQNIFWKPRIMERGEGHWIMTKTVEVGFDPYCDEWRSVSSGYPDSTRDSPPYDLSLDMLRKPRPSAPKAIEEPPLRAQAISSDSRKLASKWIRQHMPGAHLGFSYNTEWPWYSLGPSEHSWPQGERYWEYNSFLSDIRNCQDGNLFYMNIDRALWKHTGDSDCPWGCAKVHLDEFHVPAEFQRTHPASKLPAYLRN